MDTANEPAYFEQIRDALRENKVLGYEEAIRDVVKIFEKIGNMPAVKCREATRHFVKMNGGESW